MIAKARISLVSLKMKIVTKNGANDLDGHESSNEMEKRLTDDKLWLVNLKAVSWYFQAQFSFHFTMKFGALFTSVSVIKIGLARYF